MKKFIFASMLVGAILFSGCGETKPENPDAEKPVAENIQVEDKQIPAEKSFPAPRKLAEENLIIYSTPAKYSYDNLVADIETIQKICPQVQVQTLTETLDGRKIFDVVVGDLNNDRQILIFGAMHAREYITTQIVMRQLFRQRRKVDANCYAPTLRRCRCGERFRRKLQRRCGARTFAGRDDSFCADEQSGRSFNQSIWFGRNKKS